MNVPSDSTAGGRWQSLWRVVMPVVALVVGYEAAVFSGNRADSWLRWAGFVVSVWCFMAVGPGVASWWRRLRTGSWSEPGGVLAELQGGDWILCLDQQGPAPHAVATAISEITGLKWSAARACQQCAVVYAARGGDATRGHASMPPVPGEHLAGPTAVSHGPLMARNVRAALNDEGPGRIMLLTRALPWSGDGNRIPALSAWEAMFCH